MTNPKDWIRRAASVLPLVEREAGSDLAAEVSWLLQNEAAAIQDTPRPPMFTRMVGKADGSVAIEQTEKCPTCAGEYFNVGTGWQHNCRWP